MNSRSVALAAYTHSVPVVCHVHFPLESATLRWMYRGLPRPSAFIYNSGATREDVDKVLLQSCPRAKRAVIHNCVDLQDFREIPVKRENARPIVAIVANLLEVKGHMDFLKMAQQLVLAGLEVDFWIIGGETTEIGFGSELRSRCEAMGLNHCVHFLGHRSDVPQLLEDVDVVVSASYAEPFGISNLEAMACRIPVVATRVGGIPEVVLDGVTGYLVPCGRPEMLAEKVALLLAKPELRHQLARAGHDRVRQFFGAPDHARKILDFYAEVLHAL